MSASRERSKKRDKPDIGILEWFHLNDKAHVKKTLQQLEEIGVSGLRTGLSWADYHTSEGRQWLEWLIPTLAEQVQILPCLLYTPPSIGITPKTSSPPRHPEYFADFTNKILLEFGNYFDWVELWNEPNNASEYDFRLDPDWRIFNKMIRWAAAEAKSHNKKILLGGMSPIDPGWLGHMFEAGLMDSVDGVGLHGFPGSFDASWTGWDEPVRQINSVIKHYGGEQKIWITEAGSSTWQHDEKEQLIHFTEAMEAPAERVYWYSLNDLQTSRPTVDGFHLDEREYHFGMVNEDDSPKLLYRMLKQYGLNDLNRYPWITRPARAGSQKEKSILITGGAGFIGTNLAHSFLKEGKTVTIYDNLRRPGVEKNLDWLCRTHRDKKLNIEIADIRNRYKLQKAVNQAEFIYHLASQVAVTTSQKHPRYDFDVNLTGTMNLLESIRTSRHRPPLLFTSTNKVYGNLSDSDPVPDRMRYLMNRKSVDESQKLDFYSPYGCSKGAADAYITDYTRTYGLKAAIFRMSCIYGPHQLGTEDQGWVAHFLIQALKGNPLTIYGDGKQVRDILFIDDLVDAFRIVYERMDRLTGEAFNIGGGFSNSVSLIEFIDLIEEMAGVRVIHRFSDWRNGDQKYYVSDISKINSLTGWKPKHSVSSGIRQLYRWLESTGVTGLSKKTISA